MVSSYTWFSVHYFFKHLTQFQNWQRILQRLLLTVYNLQHKNTKVVYFIDNMLFKFSIKNSRRSANLQSIAGTRRVVIIHRQFLNRF